MKLIEWPKYLSVLSKRVVGAKQKNRRCSAKESSVLGKRIDDAKRKQSIYFQKSLNCYAVEAVIWDQNIKSLFFHLGLLGVFVWYFAFHFLDEIQSMSPKKTDAPKKNSWSVCRKGIC